MILISTYYYLSCLALITFCWWDFHHRSKKGMSEMKCIYLYNLPESIKRLITTNTGTVVGKTAFNYLVAFKSSLVTYEGKKWAKIADGIHFYNGFIYLNRSKKSFKEVL